LQKASFTVRKLKDGWRVELPDGTQLGPYLARIALQVATTHVLLARKQGLATRIEVRDEHGRGHDCQIVDRVADKQWCPSCEASWPNTSGLPVRCQLYADIGGP
jgi:hypothetical protein